MDKTHKFDRKISQNTILPICIAPILIENQEHPPLYELLQRYYQVNPGEWGFKNEILY
jgi:hypothetical protein